MSPPRVDRAKTVAADVPVTPKQATPSASRDTKSVTAYPTHARRGASWKAEYERLAQTLLNREYPEKTAKAYTQWIRKFQAFTRSKPPERLSSEDASAFLASFPKTGTRAVSKQHQAYDALLLLYTHVLEKPCEIARLNREPAAQRKRPGRGDSWEAEYAKLHAEIKTRQYSPSTFKTY